MVEVKYRDFCWSDMVTVCRNDILQDYITSSTGTTHNLKGVWKKRVKTVAKDFGITVTMIHDNWHIIEKLIGSKDQVSVASSSSKSSFLDRNNTLRGSNQSRNDSIDSGSGSSSQSSKSSNTSLLGYKLTSTDKVNVTNMYASLRKDRMWKLSTGRYVEEVMNDFTLKLNYEHPSCSLVLDLSDENWIDVFSVEELNEIKTMCIEKSSSFLLPEKMNAFLNDIPKTMDIIEIFNHINKIVIDPATDRDLYWLKMTIQQAADLFITKYLPITDHSERDIMRRVWGFVDTAFDGSKLTCRSEKTSKACSSENNKRRKIAAEEVMRRKTTGEIPDYKFACERYELGAVEVSKDLYDNTKELNDGSIKIAKIMKSMSLNIVRSNPELQHKLKIMGMFIAELKINFLELTNPVGYVCVLRKTNEFYYPALTMEFRKRIIPLVKQVWITKLIMESELDSIMTSELGDDEPYLTPCFQKKK